MLQSLIRSQGLSSNTRTGSTQLNSNQQLNNNGNKSDNGHTKSEFDNHQNNIQKAKTPTSFANQVIFTILSLF